MDFSMLTAALQDPNSPLRMQLLDNLAMSPLDPAAAFQQAQQETLQMQKQSLPQFAPQGPQGPDFTAILDGEASAPGGGGWVPPQTASATQPEQPAADPEKEKAEKYKKMLEGVGSMLGKREKQTYPGAPSAGGNNWRGFTAAQFQTPNVTTLPSLAALLEGRQ
ncbi:hypothetical protein [Methylocaldum sp.]|uniref:hypothetical protein n=1 Tax=Methylocaldum sp. TaxID=1969727 RepID=UPI002D3CC9F5|nr:hypothetical protein [Methylocaldum sp.]HYE38161.1 hypothetical protein [Methylocaldum sp.]